MLTLSEMSTSRCVKSLKTAQQLLYRLQRLNENTFSLCCFAQESPLHHVVMTSTTNPPHESGAFQFSLTLRFSLVCAGQSHFFDLSPAHKKIRLWSTLYKHMRYTGVHGHHCRRLWLFGARGSDIPPPGTHSTEPQGAWWPEGPQLPATPSAMLEKRSPSCTTLC